MSRLARVLRAAVGEIHWSAPAWLRACGWPLRALAAYQRRSPRAFQAALAALLTALVGGVALERWIASWPEPEYLAVSVDEPEPTALVADAQPDPLRIQFSGAAAPLERVGKVPSTQDFVVAPALAGAWLWEDDRTLVFTPSEDWPVGQAYRLTLQEGFLAPQARLASPQIEFRSPRLSARLASTEFYEDPTDPKNKRVVVAIQFSHAVDRASLERHLELRLRLDPERSWSARGVRALGFALSFDEWGARAFVHSEPIAIAEAPGAVRLELAAGVLAARAGTPSADATDVEVTVPGLETYFRASGASGSVVSDDDHRMQRVVTLAFSAPVRVENLREQVEVWELPLDRPAIGSRARQSEYRWNNASEVVPEVLAAARRVAADWLPSEPEWAKRQSFRFQADAGRTLYVRVAKGTRSFGDYPLARDFRALVQVEAYPRSVEILHDGSLLALSGSGQLGVLARNLPAVQVELARLLPQNVVHLATQSRGSFQEPQFSSGRFNLDNLAQLLTEVRPLPPAEAGEPQYLALDLGSARGSGGAPRGLFEVRVRGWDPERGVPLGDAVARRLVLLSDLGFLVKDVADGSHELFALSIASGKPLVGAQVEILGRNGLPILSRTTDAQGRALLPPTSSFRREQEPAAYVLRQGDDFSFLPFGQSGRRLEWARFDVGGVVEASALESLQAVLFSDRGIYRPGEEAAIAIAVKKLDWSALPPGLELQISLVDPRGVEVRSERLPLAGAGFQDWRFTPRETAPTGTYQVQLHLLREGTRRGLLAELGVRVEEFQPDRLRIAAQLSAASSAGWVAPSALAGRVALRNLFGTPAVGNTVKAALQLSPVLPAFARWSEWTFFDPLKAKQGYQETLAELPTDAAGELEFPLRLERFERASYRLRFVAEGFEAEGGRSVVAQAGAIVSPLPYLIGWKADGDFSYLRQGSEHRAQLLAIGPDLEPLAAPDVSAELLEIRAVKVLTRGANGLLAYQSVDKTRSLRSEPLRFGAQPSELLLPTATPGRFAYVLRDAEGTELNRIPFQVVGEGNAAARIERDAELVLALSKGDYAPGEEIEVSIQAPYAGAGLITLERERVYAAQWFSAEGSASVQRIRVPPELEGNGYLVVSLLRDLRSPEVFLSPLSSAVAPFSVSRAQRTQQLELDVPERVEPGQPLRIGWTTGAPTRLAVLAVDEGILQVARWSTPDPLSHFLRKRALTVSTSQILDLVLPEYELVRALAAPGGDTDALLGANLNPFRRKNQRPAAFWSGVQDVPAGAGALEYTVSDYFSGTLRVVAVAVNESAVGVAQDSVIARGPFVLQPTLPTFAAPGDEFEASALVANVLEGSGPETRVALALETSPELELVGPGQQELVIPEGRDATVRWRLRAKGALGVARVTLRAAAQGRELRQALELSVRAASPRRTSVATAVAARGGTAELAADRALHAELRQVYALAATSPLALIPGLTQYLVDYPHGCAEQLVSQALPGVVLAPLPDLALDAERARSRTERALEALRAQQNAEGGFGLWPGESPSETWIDAYATHFLMEAQARGQAVPQAMLSRALEHLREIATADASSVRERWDLRARAYALYLVTRSGRAELDAARALAAALERVAPSGKPRDAGALLLAASFEQLRLPDDARRLAAGVSLAASAEPDYRHYYDAGVDRALTLYLLAAHFPERARALTASELLEFAAGLGADASFNTHSAALSILALDAWAALQPPGAAAAIALAELDAQGAVRELTPSGERVRRAPLSLQAARARFSGLAGTPLFHQLVQSGFDREPPRERAAEGLEVSRELRSAAGAPAVQVGIEDKLEVVLYLRAADGAERSVALIDLLPGGFEVDLSSPELAQRRSLHEGDDSWHPEAVDVREDRVVLYGWADAQARRFVYRLRPLSRGRFAVPPVQVEGLYDRRAWGRGLGGEIRIGD